MSHSSDREPIGESAVDPSGDHVTDSGGRRQSRVGRGRSNRPHWSTLATLAVALVAVAIGVVGWFRPPGPGHESFSNQQTQDAKKSMCEASAVVSRGVTINTNRQNPAPDDPIGPLAVAANARVALSGGGAYLRKRLAELPATPADLTKVVGSMSDTLEELAVNYSADAPASAQDPLRNNLQSEIAQVSKLCA